MADQVIGRLQPGPKTTGKRLPDPRKIQTVQSEFLSVPFLQLRPGTNWFRRFLTIPRQFIHFFAIPKSLVMPYFFPLPLACHEQRTNSQLSLVNSQSPGGLCYRRADAVQQTRHQ